MSQLLVLPFPQERGAQIKNTLRNRNKCQAPELSDSFMETLCSGVCLDCHCQFRRVLFHRTFLVFQARKKSTKIDFLGPETAGWGEGLPHEGVGVEKSAPEGTGNVPGILPGCLGRLGVFKRFVQKELYRHEHDCQHHVLVAGNCLSCYLCHGFNRGAFISLADLLDVALMWFGPLLCYPLLATSGQSEFVIEVDFSGTSGGALR